MRPAERILRSDEFRGLAIDQDEVMSIRQLTALGLDRRVIRRRDGVQWQMVGRHVVVLNTGALTRRQQWWAGVLHAGVGSTLAGLTALEAGGLRSFDSDIVHVLAQHGSGRRSLDADGVRIRVRERTMLDRDVRVGCPPRTPNDRAAVDAASWASSDGRSRAILAATVQQRLGRAPDMRAIAELSLTLPRRALILETIDDVEGGSHSVPELEWIRGIRRFGLPEPARQHVLRHSSGRYYLDARFDPWNVAVEINGVQHLELLASEADDARRFALSAGGLLVVDISSYLVRHRIGVAMLRTARGLYARGWRPASRAYDLLAATANKAGEPLWLPAAA